MWLPIAVALWLFCQLALTGASSDERVVSADPSSLGTLSRRAQFDPPYFMASNPEDITSLTIVLQGMDYSFDYEAVGDTRVLFTIQLPVKFPAMSETCTFTTSACGPPMTTDELMTSSETSSPDTYSWNFRAVPSDVVSVPASCDPEEWMLTIMCPFPAGVPLPDLSVGGITVSVKTAATSLSTGVSVIPLSTIAPAPVPGSIRAEVAQFAQSGIWHSRVAVAYPYTPYLEGSRLSSRLVGQTCKELYLSQALENGPAVGESSDYPYPHGTVFLDCERAPPGSNQAGPGFALPATVDIAVDHYAPGARTPQSFEYASLGNIVTETDLDRSYVSPLILRNSESDLILMMVISGGGSYSDATVHFDNLGFISGAISCRVYNPFMDAGTPLNWASNRIFIDLDSSSLAPFTLACHMTLKDEMPDSYGVKVLFKKGSTSSETETVRRMWSKTSPTSLRNPIIFHGTKNDDSFDVVIVDFADPDFVSNDNFLVSATSPDIFSQNGAAESPSCRALTVQKAGDFASNTDAVTYSLETGASFRMSMSDIKPDAFRPLSVMRCKVRTNANPRPYTAGSGNPTSAAFAVKFSTSPVRSILPLAPVPPVRSSWFPTRYVPKVGTSASDEVDVDLALSLFSATPFSGLFGFRGALADVTKITVRFDAPHNSRPAAPESAVVYVETDTSYDSSIVPDCELDGASIVCVIELDAAALNAMGAKHSLTLHMRKINTSVSRFGFLPRMAGSTITYSNELGSSQLYKQTFAVTPRPTPLSQIPGIPMAHAIVHHPVTQDVLPTADSVTDITFLLSMIRYNPQRVVELEITFPHTIADGKPLLCDADITFNSQNGDPWTGTSKNIPLARAKNIVGEVFTMTLTAGSTENLRNRHVRLTCKGFGYALLPFESGDNAIHILGRQPLAGGSAVILETLATVSPVQHRRLRLVSALTPKGSLLATPRFAIRIALPGSEDEPYMGDFSSAFSLRPTLVTDAKWEITTAVAQLNGDNVFEQPEIDLDYWSEPGKLVVTTLTATLSAGSASAGTAKALLWMRTPHIFPCFDVVPPSKFYSAEATEEALKSRNYGSVRRLVCLDNSNVQGLICIGQAWYTKNTLPTSIAGTVDLEECAPTRVCDLREGFPSALNIATPVSNITFTSVIPGVLDEGDYVGDLTCSDGASPADSTETSTTVTVHCGPDGIMYGGCAKTCTAPGFSQLGSETTTFPVNPDLAIWTEGMVAIQECSDPDAVPLTPGTLHCDGTNMVGNPLVCSRCPPPKPEDNAVYSPAKAAYAEGETVTASCKINDVSITDTSTSFLTCTATGWTGTKQCNHVGCAVPTPDINFRFSFPTSREADGYVSTGTTGLIECLSPLVLATLPGDPPPSITCENDFRWTWAPPNTGQYCVLPSPNHCSMSTLELGSNHYALSKLRNVNFVGDLFVFQNGGTAVLECDSGSVSNSAQQYQLIKCDSGLINSPNLECYTNKCQLGALPSTNNGMCLSSEVTEVAGLFEYQAPHGYMCFCDPGYIPDVSGNAEPILYRTCLNTDWSPETSTCIEAICPAIDFVSGPSDIIVDATGENYDETDRNMHRPDVELTVKCHANYTLSGPSGKIKCDNGVWDHSLGDPACIPSTCMAPENERRAMMTFSFVEADLVTPATPSPDHPGSPRPHYPAGTVLLLGCTSDHIPDTAMEQITPYICNGDTLSFGYSTPAIDVCRLRKKCVVEVITDSTSIVPAVSETVIEGDVLRYSCADMYEPVKGLGTLKCMSDGKFEEKPMCVAATGCRGPLGAGSPEYDVDWVDASGNPTGLNPHGTYDAGTIFSAECVPGLSGVASYPDAFVGTCVKTNKGNFEWEFADGFEFLSGIPFGCEVSDCPSVAISERGSVTYDSTGKFEGGNVTVNCDEYYSGEQTVHQCLSGAWEPPIFCRQTYCRELDDPRFRCTFTGGDGSKFYPHDAIATCSCGTDWFHIDDRTSQNVTCVTPLAPQESEWDLDPVEPPRRLCAPKADCMVLSNVTDVTYERNNLPYTHPDPSTPFPLGTIARRRCVSYPWEPADDDVATMTTTCREYGWDNFEFESYPLCQFRQECELPNIREGTFDPPQVYIGGSVELKCGAGFEEKDGVRTASCLEDKTLSKALSCVTRTHCSSIEGDLVVKYDSGSTTHLHPKGTTAVISCPQGKSATDRTQPDSFIAVCSDSFEWTTADSRITDLKAFTCTTTTCPSFPIQYGNVIGYTDPVKEPGSVVSISCFPGYTLMNDGTRCSPEGKWVPATTGPSTPNVVNCARAISVNCMALDDEYTYIYTHQGRRVKPDNQGAFPPDTEVRRYCTFPKEPARADVPYHSARCVSVENGWNNFPSTTLCQDIPKCTIPLVNNGEMNPADSVYRGDTVKLTCRSGFQPTKGFSVATCFASGSLSPALSCEPQTNCLPLPVDDPNNFYIKYYSDVSKPPLSEENSRLLPEGTIAKTACARGLSSSGDLPNELSFTCVKKGQNTFEWVSNNGMLLSDYSCSASYCGSLNLDHAQVSYDSTGRDAGAVATITCDPNYQAVNGVQQSTCTATGWTAAACLLAMCETYSDVTLSCSYFQTSGQPIPAGEKTFAVNSRSRCTCASDYYGDLDTNPVEFACVNQGTLPYTWVKSNNVNVDCRERILCKNFEVTNEHPFSLTYSTASSSGVFPLQTTASVRCSYPAEGISSPNAIFTATCRNSGWEPKKSLIITDHCQAMPSCTLPIIDFGDVESVDNKTVLYLGDIVRTTCEQFYTVRTSPLSTCQRGSLWEPQPECVPQECDRITHASLKCRYLRDNIPVTNRIPGTIALCSCNDNYAGAYENVAAELVCIKDFNTGFVEWMMGSPFVAPEQPVLTLDSDGFEVLSFSTLSAKSDNLTKEVSEQCVPVVPCKALKPAKSDTVSYTLHGAPVTPNADGALPRETVASYFCDWPYTAIDSTSSVTQTCTIDGWSEVPTSALPVCKSLPICEVPKITNGRLILHSPGGPDSPFYAGTSYSVECDDEYYPLNGRFSTECWEDGRISNPVGCRSTHCKVPNWVSYACSFSHPDVSYPNDVKSVKLDSVATCRCADGFLPEVPNDPSPSKPIRFRCDPGEIMSVWREVDHMRTLETRKCYSPFNCGAPPQIANGKAIYTSTIAGSYVKYECDKYYHIDGSEDLFEEVGCSATGWVKTPKCTVCTDDDVCQRPYPVVMESAFTSHYDSILLKFNVPTNQPELTTPTGATSNCIRVLNPATVTTLGAGAVCTWMKRDVLRIILGRDFLVRPGSKLSVVANRLRNSNLEDRPDFYNRAQAVTVARPAVNLGAVAVIDAPSTVSDRVGFTISGGRSRGAGGLALSYTWTLVGSTAPLVVYSTVVERFSELVDFQTTKSTSFRVGASPKYAPALAVPSFPDTADSGIFAPGYSYTIALTVTSWFDVSSTVEHTLSIPPVITPVPAVVAQGGRVIETTRGRSLYIPTMLFFATPRDTTNSLSLTWVLRSATTGETANELQFYGTQYGLAIPPFMLTPKAEYVFRATVMQQGIHGTTFETIRIKVREGSVLARSPSLGLTHSISNNLTLSAAGSRDLNVAPDDPSATLTYAWTCTVVATGAPCFAPIAPDADADEVVIHSSDLVQIFSSANASSSVQLNVTLTVAADTRTDSVNGIIILVDNSSFDDYEVVIHGPGIVHLPSQLPVRLIASYSKADDSLPDAVVFWSCDTRNVPMLDLNLRTTPTLNGPVLGFKGGALAPGTTYTFRAHLFASPEDFPKELPVVGFAPLPKELASTSFTVTPNMPPFGGSCGAARTSDGSSKHTVGSDIVLVCQGWDDDDLDIGPLTYTWYSDLSVAAGYTPNTTETSSLLVEIGPAAPEPTLTVRFSAPLKIPIVVVIADTWGSTTRVRFEVELAPGPNSPSALAMILAGAEIARNQKRPGLIAQTYVSVLRALDTGVVESTDALRQRMLEMLTDPDVTELNAATQTARVIAAEGGVAGDGILSIGRFALAKESEIKLSLIAAVCGNPAKLTATERLLASRLQIAASSDLVYRGPLSGISNEARRALLSLVGNVAASFKYEVGLVNPNVAVRTSSESVPFRGSPGIPDDGNGALITEPLGAPVADWAALTAKGQAHSYARALYASLGVATDENDVDEFGVLHGQPRARLMERIRVRAAEAAAEAAAETEAGWFSVLSAVRAPGRPDVPPGTLPMDDNTVLITALQAEAGSAANVVENQLLIAASALLESSVMGEVPVVERVNGVEILSMASSLNTVPSRLGSANAAPGVVVPSFSIPKDLTTSVRDGPPPDNVNVVFTVIDNSDLLTYAGLRAGEYLNGSSSTQLASLSFYTRGEEPVDRMIAPNVMVPVPQSIQFDTTALGENFTITLPHAKQSFELDPVCEYWSPTPGQSGVWTSEGCSVLSATPTQTVCTCTHLTLFRGKLRFRDFLPRFNTIGARDFLNLTPENVRKHPVPLIMIMVWLLITVICAILTTHIDRIKDRRALLFLREQWAKGVRGIEELRSHNPHDDSHEPMKKRMWSRVEFSLRHDHLWASIFLRDDTNSFSSTGRCITAFVLFLSSYFTNAMFYGSSQASMAFISISLISAAILIPIGLILTAVFYYTQTGRVKAMIYEYAEHVCKLRYTGMSDYPAYRDKPEHQLQWFFLCSPSVERIQLNEIAVLAGWDVSPLNQRIIPPAPRDEAKFKLKIRTMVDIQPDRLITWYNTRPILDRLPTGLRLLGFVFLFIWVLFCVMMILVYGMQFDLHRSDGTVEWLRSSALSNALDILIFRIFIIALKTLVIMFIITLILNRPPAHDQNIADRELTTIRHLDDQILRAQLAAAEEPDPECPNTDGTESKKKPELTAEELEALRQKRIAEEERQRRRQEFLRNKDLMLADLATDEGDPHDADPGTEMGRLDFGNTTQPTPPRKPRVLGTIGLDVAAPSREAAAEAVMLADEVGESYRAAPTLMAIDHRARADAPYTDSVMLGGQSFAAALAADRAAANAEEKKRRDAEAAQRSAAAQANITAATAGSASSRAGAGVPCSPAFAGQPAGSSSFTPAYKRMSFAATPRAGPGTPGGVALAVTPRPPMSSHARASAVYTNSPGAGPMATPASPQMPPLPLVRGPLPSQAPPPARHRTFVAGTSALESHLRQMAEDKDAAPHTLAPAPVTVPAPVAAAPLPVPAPVTVPGSGSGSTEASETSTERKSPSEVKKGTKKVKKVKRSMK